MKIVEITESRSEVIKVDTSGEIYRRLSPNVWEVLYFDSWEPYDSPKYVEKMEKAYQEFKSKKGPKPNIEEIGYLEEIRQRLCLKPNDSRSDSHIENMKPFERVRLIAGWKLGDESWANTFRGWCESQGIYLTTNPYADGVIDFSYER